ncbi:MAG: pentapeptide repeat-containing protein [Cyanobacteria bacterium J06633_8]
MSGASLCKTKFGGANLSGAILRGAFVEKTEFSNANLSCVDLRGAVGIEIAYLDEAIFHDTIMPDGSIANDTAYFLLVKHMMILEETLIVRVSQFLALYLLPNSCNY